MDKKVLVGDRPHKPLGIEGHTDLLVNLEFGHRYEHIRFQDRIGYQVVVAAVPMMLGGFLSVEVRPIILPAGKSIEGPVVSEGYQRASGRIPEQRPSLFLAGEIVLSFILEPGISEIKDRHGKAKPLLVQ